MCDGNCFECKYDDCIATDKEINGFNVKEKALSKNTEKRNPGNSKIDWNDYEQVKEYQRIKSLIYYHKHKEECKAKRKEYYLAHHEAEKEKRRKYYHDHREQENERLKKYLSLEENKKKRREYQRKYYLEHKKGNKERTKKKCDENCFECKYSDCILSEDEIKLKPLPSNRTEKQKEYMREYMKKYSQTPAYKEKEKERHHRYYLQHREERIEYAKKYNESKKV